MKDRKKCRRGFTLAELIMAIALLAVFSVFIVQMFAKADQLARKARTLDQAVACTANLADQWKMTAEADVPQEILNLRKDRKDGLTETIDLDYHFQTCAAADAVYKVEMILKQGAPGEFGKKAAASHVWQLTLVVVKAASTDSGPIYTLTACRYFPEEVAAK